MVAEQSLQSRILYTGPTAWQDFHFIQNDSFKELSEGAKQRLKASILSNEFSQPFYAWREEATGDVYCLDGRHRCLALAELAREGHIIPHELEATFIRCESKKEAAALVLQYSSQYAKITEEGLFGFVEQYGLQWGDVSEKIDLPGHDALDIMAKMNAASSFDDTPAESTTLQERFLIPPFSVFDTRQGYWQNRKKQWHDMGINSQETREDVELIAQSGQSTAVYELRNKMREALGRDPSWDEITAKAKEKGLHLFEGASVFDPVLCEIIYKWFGFPGATVLDPFAGGSVRGIVAGKCGLEYLGIDLRPEQVEANIKQGKEVGVENVTWMAGDSAHIGSMIDNNIAFDLLFSCPPYHDLEVYSEDKNDLSNMNYEDFKNVYTAIIQKSVAELKDDRFACFVVSEIRDKKGWYKGFVQDTINAFESAGARLYNEIILVNVAGSLPMRIGRQFGGYRKVGKMHQNVLVFYKGDPKQIPVNYPEIQIEDLLPEVSGIEQL